MERPRGLPEAVGRVSLPASASQGTQAPRPNSETVRQPWAYRELPSSQRCCWRCRRRSCTGITTRSSPRIWGTVRLWVDSKRGRARSLQRPPAHCRGCIEQPARNRKTAASRRDAPETHPPPLPPPLSPCAGGAAAAAAYKNATCASPDGLAAECDPARSPRIVVSRWWVGGLGGATAASQPVLGSRPTSRPSSRDGRVSTSAALLQTLHDDARIFL